MIVDYVRSCYSTQMRFTEGEAPVAVTWHFAKEGAGLFPGWNSFASRNWDSRQSLGDEIGEVGPYVWSNGKPLEYGNDMFTCDDLDWFDTGIPVGEVPPQPNPDWPPDCCSEAPPPCCGCNIPDSLTITASNLGGLCPCLDGLSCTIERVSTDCQWAGTLGTCGGVTATLLLGVTDDGMGNCVAVLTLLWDGIGDDLEEADSFVCISGDFVSADFVLILHRGDIGCQSAVGFHLEP